jgi:hypothetical protein
MKYLGVLVLFLISYTVFAFVFSGTWHWLNPFLISLIFLYYSSSDPWIYYGAAFVFGLTLDAFSPGFAFYTLSFLLVLFLISNLQLTIFSSKNTGTIIFLTLIANILFYFIYYFIYWLSDTLFYVLSWSMILSISRFILLDTLLVVVFYVLYFNLWLKKHSSA